MPEIPDCPVCHSPEPVVKVSQVYISGITNPADRSEQDRARLEAVFGKGNFSAAETRQITHLFGPPSGRKQGTRPIHPDMYMFVLAAVTVVFLLNTYSKQQTFFGIILFISVIFGVVYFFTRNKAVARFSKRLEEGEAEKLAVDRAVGEWMKVYYCCNDGCLFDPSREDTASLEELHRYLIQRPPFQD
jgi:hypothetical protein